LRTFALALLGVAVATAASADDQVLRGRTRFDYYACVDSKARACYAFTEKQKRECACGGWQQRTFDHDFSADLDGDVYLHKEGKAHGSRLLADFEMAVTGKPADEAPTFAEIYKSPRAHDYLEVPADVDIQPGMAAVYPNFGGIFTDEAKGPSEGRIVYSSKASAGDLERGTLRWVGPRAARPKILFNTALLEVREPAYWNVWARPEGGGASTLVLRPGESYDLRVDLAALRYRQASLAGGVSVNARDELDKLLGGTARAIGLDLVLVTGDEFDDSNDRHQKLSIDLEKMRQWYASGSAPMPGLFPPPDPLALVADGGQPKYLFSSGDPFQVRTAKAARGMAVLAVSIWKGIPIDEITFSLCIAPPGEEGALCRQPAVLSEGFSALRQVDGVPNVPPDAAVSFLARGPDQSVFGILRDTRPGGDDKFVYWTLGKTMAELRAFVARSLEPVFSTGNLLLNARGWYQELFPTAEAQEALSRIIGAEMEGQVPDPAPVVGDPALPLTSPPRLLFRIIDGGELVTLPVSFLVWPRANGDLEPIAFHYILDVPIGKPAAKRQPACLSRWVMLYPSADQVEDKDPVKLAVLRAKTTLDGWAVAAETPFPANDIRKFGEWLASGKETSGAAIVLLAHHAADRLWFQTREPISASLVGHSFAAPTVAILDGCGTGGSAANEFARKLSLNGVDAMVVTNTDIKDDLAGDYLNMLHKELEASQSRPGFDLAYAHFQTLRRLRVEKSGDTNKNPYNARALAFMLVGNGELRLCGPQGGGTP